MEEVPSTTGPRYWYFYTDAEAWAAHMGAPAARHGETHKVSQYRQGRKIWEGEVAVMVGKGPFSVRRHPYQANKTADF